jgi:predicted methyltransferase
MKSLRTCALVAASLLSTATIVQVAYSETRDAAQSTAAATKPDPVLEQVVAGDWRSAEAKARDKYRHPVESLTFWGLKPGMTVLEIQPGGASWWTELLAPYTHRTGGKFDATGADLADPKLSDGAKAARKEFETHYANKDLYGDVRVVNWGPNSAPLPPQRYDFILTARSVHGWMRQPSLVDRNFTQFFNALKPGGILALEQHRANPGPQDPDAKSGYVTEAFVIEHAEKAGFKLVDRSEINANPRDTKDHPFGVWTLPPTLRSTEYGDSNEDPKFDHSKYVAIGESDRMTLKFVKP